MHKNQLFIFLILAIVAAPLFFEKNLLGAEPCQKLFNPVLPLIFPSRLILPKKRRFQDPQLDFRFRYRTWPDIQLPKPSNEGIRDLLGLEVAFLLSDFRTLHGQVTKISGDTKDSIGFLELELISELSRANSQLPMETEKIEFDQILEIRVKGTPSLPRGRVQYQSKTRTWIKVPEDFKRSSELIGRKVSLLLKKFHHDTESTSYETIEGVIQNVPSSDTLESLSSHYTIAIKKFGFKNLIPVLIPAHEILEIRVLRDSTPFRIATLEIQRKYPVSKGWIEVPSTVSFSEVYSRPIVLLLENGAILEGTVLENHFSYLQIRLLDLSEVQILFSKIQKVKLSSNEIEID